MAHLLGDRLIHLNYYYHDYNMGYDRNEERLAMCKPYNQFGEDGSPWSYRVCFEDGLENQEDEKKTTDEGETYVARPHRFARIAVVW